MQITLSEQALELVRDRGGRMAIDYSPPSG